MENITIFLLASSRTGISEAWVNHLTSFYRHDVNLILVTTEALANEERFKALNASRRVVFSGKQSPYALINALAQEMGNGFFTVIRPGHFLSITHLKALVAFLEEGEHGHKLGLVILQYCKDESVAYADISNLPEEKSTALNYAEMLYDPSQLRPQLVWHFSVHEQLGFFRADLNMLAEQEFYLRSLKHGQFAMSTLPAGYYCLTAEECTADHRQAYYEEELALKEEYIRFVMSPDYVPDAPLTNELALHARMVSFFLQKLQDGKDILVDEFERHLFIYALIAVKSGALKDAKDALYIFFSLRGRSRNCAHLYRILLTLTIDKYYTRQHINTDISIPIISVVIPLYNYGRYLRHTIASIVAQTMDNWELIIVNDGSTDDSLCVAKQLLSTYNDPRMRVMSKSNEGAPKTRNFGIRHTTAPYICVLDSDDMVAPTYFETAISLLKQDEDVGWVNPQALHFGGNNHLTWNWKYDFIHSLIKCPCPVSAIFRRDMWEELNGFKEDISCREDWEFWIRAGEGGWRADMTPEPMFLYRHAFERWSTKPKENISSKQTIVSEHRWWYKKMSEPEQMVLFNASTVGEFPQEILDEAAVEKVRPVLGNKLAIRECVESLRSVSSSKPHAAKSAFITGGGISWSDTPLDYAIVNLTQDNWVYSHAMDDIALPLCYSLRRMGYRVEIFTNTLSSSGVNIIFGLQDRSDLDLSSIPTNSIIYNFEQIKPGSKGFRPHYIEAMRRFRVWEYSLANLEILRCDFGVINIIHVPFGYCPEMTRLDSEYPADIDVLLYGYLNDRRMSVIRELQESGVKALAIEKVFGEERDFLIARSKIILNVHYYVPGIQEIVRLGYLWANYKPVICECNADTIIHQGYENACIYAPYEELVSKTLDCLRAPKALKMQAELGFRVFSSNDYRHILRERACIPDKNVSLETFSAPVPDFLNVGSGKDFRRDALNIDIESKWNPDLLLDMSKPLDFTKPCTTQRFGSFSLRPGMFKYIRAFDVIEHVFDISQMMKNLLDLLEDSGILHLNVPYDLSHGAWQDPTHLHAFNEQSWLYYTDWAWYLGWREDRFHLEKLNYIYSDFGKTMQAKDLAQQEIIRTPRAVDSMEVLLKKRRATPEELTEYDRRRRAFYKNAVGEWTV